MSSTDDNKSCVGVDHWLTNNRKRHQLAVGQRGFLVTCNFKEKECIRESYNILNGQLAEACQPATEPMISEMDITDCLRREIDLELLKKNSISNFQAADTGVKNCIFIKTAFEDPIEIGVELIKRVYQENSPATRYVLRFIPVPIVCRANVVDIVFACSSLIEKYFVSCAASFSIVINKRFNNKVDRDLLIEKIAELVTAKNPAYKVDLKNPDLCILVEVIKGICCLSVLPDYYKYKKYNLMELIASKLNDGT